MRHYLPRLRSWYFISHLFSTVFLWKTLTSKYDLVVTSSPFWIAADNAVVFIIWRIKHKKIDCFFCFTWDTYALHSLLSPPPSLYFLLFDFWMEYYAITPVHQLPKFLNWCANFIWWYRDHFDEIFKNIFGNNWCVCDIYISSYGSSPAKSIIHGIYRRCVIKLPSVSNKTPFLAVYPDFFFFFFNQGHELNRKILVRIKQFLRDSGSYLQPDPKLFLGVLLIRDTYICRFSPHFPLWLGFRKYGASFSIFV